MTVKPKTNKSGAVNGTNYTGHAFDQMQGRGVVPSMVKEALTNGKKVKTNLKNNTSNYKLGDLEVVVNQNGTVVTVITK